MSGFDLILVGFRLNAAESPARVLERLLGLTTEEAKAKAKRFPLVVLSNASEHAAESLRRQFDAAGARVKLVAHDVAAVKPASSFAPVVAVGTQSLGPAAPVPEARGSSHDTLLALDTRSSPKEVSSLAAPRPSIPTERLSDFAVPHTEPSEVRSSRPSRNDAGEGYALGDLAAPLPMLPAFSSTPPYSNPRGLEPHEDDAGPALELDLHAHERFQSRAPQTAASSPARTSHVAPLPYALAQAALGKSASLRPGAEPETAAPSPESLFLTKVNGPSPAVPSRDIPQLSGTDAPKTREGFLFTPTLVFGLLFDNSVFLGNAGFMAMALDGLGLYGLVFGLLGRPPRPMRWLWLVLFGVIAFVINGSMFAYRLNDESASIANLLTPGKLTIEGVQGETFARADLSLDGEDGSTYVISLSAPPGESAPGLDLELDLVSEDSAKLRETDADLRKVQGETFTLEKPEGDGDAISLVLWPSGKKVEVQSGTLLIESAEPTSGAEGLKTAPVKLRLTLALLNGETLSVRFDGPLGVSSR